MYVCTRAQQPITLWNAPCFPCLDQFRCSADLLGQRQFANGPATGAAHSRVCICAPVGKSMSLAESPCAKRARVQQLQLLLQENRRELAQCRQRVARWAAKRGNLGLTSAGQKAVLACYCLSNYNSAIATKLAQQLSDLERSSPQFPSEPLVQSLFRETNLGELLRLHSDDDDWTKARNVAVRFVAEVKTVDYVHSQNSLHGVAPTSAEVFAHFAQTRSGGLPEVLPSRDYIKKWAAGWRKRFGIRRAALPMAIPADAPSLRAKVLRVVSV